mmetsp:Transcript_40856/g.115567  ORF Transcript_40856/g.115567 Transcript_40856/m.115567 type:complete len:209 (+) Transcript_40856:1052-1678(+)
MLRFGVPAARSLHPAWAAAFIAASSSVGKYTTSLPGTACGSHAFLTDFSIRRATTLRLMASALWAMFSSPESCSLSTAVFHVVLSSTSKIQFRSQTQLALCCPTPPPPPGPGSWKASELLLPRCICLARALHLETTSKNELASATAVTLLYTIVLSHSTGHILACTAQLHKRNPCLKSKGKVSDLKAESKEFIPTPQISILSILLCWN